MSGIDDEHSLERALIGAALFGPDEYVNQSLTIVNDADFEDPVLRRIWQAVRDSCEATGKAPDINSVFNDVKSSLNGTAPSFAWYAKLEHDTPTSIDPVVCANMLIREVGERRKTEIVAEARGANSPAAISAAKRKIDLVDARLEEIDGLRKKEIDQWDGAAILAMPEPQPPEELVERLLVRKGVHIIFGPPQSGKSAVTLAAMLDLVMGGGCFFGSEELQITTRRSFETNEIQDRVLWCFGSEDTLEDQQWRLRSVHASGPHYDKPLPPGAFIFATPPGTTVLNNYDGLDWLRQKIVASKATVVVLDTVASLTGDGFDPDKAGPVALFLKSMHRLRDELGVTIILVHHTRKGSTDSKAVASKADAMMGSQAWRALTQTVLMCDATDGQVEEVVVRPVKTKGVRNPIPKFRASFDRAAGRFRLLLDDEQAPAPAPAQPTGRPSKCSADAVIALRAKNPAGVPWKSLHTLLGVTPETFHNNSKKLQARLLELGHVVVEGNLKWAS